MPISPGVYKWRLSYAANIAGIGAYATTVDCTEKL
jgi:hypothetical protein